MSIQATIDRHAIEEGCRVILKARTNNLGWMALYASVAVIAATAAWSLSGNRAVLEIGSNAYSEWFRHAVKTSAALIVASCALALIFKIKFWQENVTVSKMVDRWMAETGGTMVVGVFDDLIAYKAKGKEKKIALQQITSLLEGKNCLVLVINDPENKTFYLPIEKRHEQFINAIKSTWPAPQS